ncbi:MAG TPA: ABC transporter permease [Streptosporangiaceae bacterium]|nr:ABC transporter permease [Streptosporangiaceae bacterium]
MNTHGTYRQRLVVRDWDLLARLGLCLVVIVGFAVAVPGFLSRDSGFAVLQVVAPLGLAGLGIGVTMIAGEVDLSIGSMAALGGVLAIHLGSHGWALGIFIPVLIGAVLGAAQGIVISAVRISSLVLTIGTLILFSGLAYLFSGENAISLPSFGVGSFLDTELFILSPYSLIFIGVTVATWLLLRYSRVGQELYAIGGGRQEAQAAGVSTLRPLAFAFAFSGAMGALTGTLVSMESGGATPTGFTSTLLNAVAAAVIGGVALTGGRGSPWGIALGAIALGVITNGVDVLGAQDYVTQFLTGGLLFLVLVAEMVLRGGRRSQLLDVLWRRPAQPVTSPPSR